MITVSSESQYNRLLYIFKNYQHLVKIKLTSCLNSAFIDNENKIILYADNEIFYFADIKNASGAAIVTINAHPSLTNIHHRQPMFLDRLETSFWLKNKQKVSSSSLLERIKSHPVSKYVNSPINNDQRCILETHM